MAETNEAIERRLERMEARLEQLTSLLTAQLARSPEGEREEQAIFGPAFRQVEKELAAEHGVDALRQQVVDALYMVTDPEAMEALARVVALAPKLEYALSFVAAGPELLEEGLEMVQEHTAARQVDIPAMLQNMVDLAEQLIPVGKALPVQERTLELLKAANEAVEQAAREEATEPLGPWGLIRALSEPRIRRAAGFAAAVARNLGERLEEPHALAGSPRAAGKLPAGR